MKICYVLTIMLIMSSSVDAKFFIKWKSSRNLGRVSFYNNIQFYDGVIFVGSYGSDSWDPDSLDRLWAIDAKTGNVIWNRKLPEDVFGILLADINYDRIPELVVSCFKGYLYAFDTEGNILWKFDQGGSYGEGFAGSATAADIDKDGEIEIIVGSTNGYLYFLSSDGKLKWRYKTEGGVLSSPAVADIDGDAQLEIIFDSKDSYLYVLSSDGKLKWRYKTGNCVYSSPAVADIDGDAQLEIIFGSDDSYLYVLSSDGKLKWRYKTGDEISSSPAVADIDGDGQLEIIFGSDDSYLYVLSSDGKLKWRYKTGNCVYSSPAVADIDGDGQLEIIFGSVDHYLYVLSSDGKLKWRYKTGGEIYSSPAVADIDGDGRLEIIFGSDDGYLYCVGGTGAGSVVWAKFRPSKFGNRLRSRTAGSVVWAKFRGNSYNTGVYGHALSYGKWVKSPIGFWKPYGISSPNFYDKEPPEITITSPNAGIKDIAVIPDDTIKVMGKAIDPSGIKKVTINGEIAWLMPTESGVWFTQTLKLPSGKNTIEVKAFDNVGNVATVKFTVNVKKKREEKTRDLLALIVGISEYKESSLNLKYADDDALLFEEFLKGPNVGIPPKNIVLLTNEEATRENIMKELQRIMNQADRNSFIIIYFSLHGVPFGRTLYFMPYEAKQDNIIGTGIPLYDIFNVVSLTSSRRVLFIFDACHSGAADGFYAFFTPNDNFSIRKVRSEYATRTNQLMSELSKKLDEKSGVAVLASTSGYDLSVEDSRWGGGHGVFTWFLVKGLKGAADRNGDGIVTLGEAFDYVREKVISETNGRQTPRLLGGYEKWPLSIVSY